MKPFIKLKSFWKGTNWWIVKVDNILFVEDKDTYRDIIIRINGEASNKLIRVENSIDEIYNALNKN